ncbi:predicted protein [Naegleria gruberi]|uniref:Predicted protein n=1 Tax=Naegleria gruberi TaxID=5762 RepID=D2V2X6_NAEGR|nr:uncharacterized protein NAEGRDRAFT_63152 [Naegleria gruberi]EFC48971.1 predicted protein [Naegleria gruberi]|eukprot:XP_002681715.1 predicted protein [Naegleria gruberi strain NEG-M]
MKYIPQNYLNVNLYRVYYDDNVSGNTLEDHRKMLLNNGGNGGTIDHSQQTSFILPDLVVNNSEITRQWKILNLKLFYQFFERAKNDCHVHQLITKEQSKKFERNDQENKRITISLSSTVLDPNLPEKVAQELASPTTQVDHTDSTFDENLCCICLDAPISITTGCCNAQFCERCLTDWNKKNTTCPMCRKPLDVNNREEQSDAWVTIQKEDFILPREEVANQFIRFVSIKLNHTILW